MILKFRALGDDVQKHSVVSSPDEEASHVDEMSL